MVGSCLGKLLSVIPILIAVIAGYAAALACGIVDFTEVKAASFFALPNFSSPKFSMEAILIMLPVILVIASEHIGHQIVTSKIVGRDLIKDPGLHRTLFADNFSTMLSGMIGSVPTTTYGENIGVMAVTGVYSVRVIAGAAVLSMVCLVGKLSTLISTDPGTCDRRNFIPALRNDRNIRNPYPCGLQSRLRKVQKPGADFRHFRDGTFRYCGKVRRY